jgi:hypothetical protein
MRDAIAAAMALILLTTCTVLGGSSRNPACEAVGSAEASEALRQEVQAEPSPIEAFFFSCDYYLPAPREVLADLDLYEEEAKQTFEADRNSMAESPAEMEFRNEDIGVPAYSRIGPDVALAGALDDDRYYAVSVFVDRYGETPESAREAAVRLLQAAVRQ